MHSKTVILGILWLFVALIVGASTWLVIETKVQQTTIPPLVIHAHLVLSKVVNATPAQVQILSYQAARFMRSAADCTARRGAITGYTITFLFRNMYFDYAVDQHQLTAVCHLRFGR